MQKHDQTEAGAKELEKKLPHFDVIINSDKFYKSLRLTTLQSIADVLINAPLYPNTARMSRRVGNNPRFLKPYAGMSDEQRRTMEKVHKVNNLLHESEKFYTPSEVTHKVIEMVQKMAEVHELPSPMLAAVLEYYNRQQIDVVAVPEFLEVTNYEANSIELVAPEDKIILINEFNRVKQIITDVYRDNSQLFRIHFREFEEMIGELLRKEGLAVELTKQTRDGGYDIIAFGSMAGFPIKFLAECKHWDRDRPVTVDLIRSFSYVIDKERANKGLIFTTSYFTRDARIEKDKGYSQLLDFMEYDDIINWVNAYVKK